ncbi:MAG: rhodanese-like domain-containing protein [Ferruginibacter sp.]
MFDSIKNLFGIATKPDYAELIKNGAIILDVRSKGEFESGHIRGAVNIPVDQLRNNLNKLKDKNIPIITCCASGMRSAAAKTLLKANGYSTVHNGGGWSSLQRRL